MSLIIWGLVAFMLGLAIYIAGPILVGPLLPQRLRRTIAGAYWSQATATMRRTTLVDRINSGYTLISTDFDAEWGCEVADVGDQEYRIKDPKNRMTRLYSRPFGMLSERFDVYCSVTDAALGKLHQLHTEQGDHIVDVVETDENGEEVGEFEAGNAHMTVPDRLQSVSLHGIAGLLGGQASPTLGEDVYDDVKKSQAAFDSRNIIEVMSFIVAFVAPYAAMWFAATQGGATGGSSIDVPLVLGVLVGV